MENNSTANINVQYPTKINAVHVSKTSFIKSIILIILVSILVYCIYSYMNNKPNTLAKYLEDLFIKGYKDIKNIFNPPNKTTETTPPNAVTGVVENEQKTLGIPLSSNKYKFDNSGNSMLQKRGKTSYCYVGTDRGFRSCIQMGGEDKCQSGEIYKDERMCKHPNLRT
jgi:hypothetical protein